MSYARIQRDIWVDDTFVGLDPATGSDSRLLAFYLLSGPHSTTEGYYRLPEPVAADDLGWDLDRYRAALGELERVGFAQFDPDAKIVFVCRALKDQPPRGTKSITGALNAVKPLRRSIQGAFFEAAAARFAPDFHKALQADPDWDPPQPENDPDQPKHAPSMGHQMWHRSTIEGASVSLALTQALTQTPPTQVCNTPKSGDPKPGGGNESSNVQQATEAVRLALVAAGYQQVNIGPNLTAAAERALAQGWTEADIVDTATGITSQTASPKALLEYRIRDLGLRKPTAPDHAAQAAPPQPEYFTGHQLPDQPAPPPIDLRNQLTRRTRTA